MDEIRSDSSPPIAAPVAAAVLGIKGPLRLRRHGASQKAHVALRRVDGPDDPKCPSGKPTVAYFSLFAQKRIEVKPGKEILLTVPSEDGSFTEQAVIFEGDLHSTESTSEEEDEVENQIVQGDPVPDPPLTHVVPPKMRRTWIRQLEQVSMEPDTFVHLPRTYVSIGVQTRPVSAVQVQAVPTPSRTQKRETLLVSESNAEPHAVVDQPYVKPNTSQSSQSRRSPSNDAEIPGAEPCRSLSPMSMGSPPSTPPQPPVAAHPTNVAEILSTSPLGLPVRIIADGSPSRTRTHEEKPQMVPTQVVHSSTAPQLSPATSETVDMDLQSSPSLPEVDEDEIPGLITGLAPHNSRSAVPQRQPSPPPPPILPSSELPSFIRLPTNGVVTSFDSLVDQRFRQHTLRRSRSPVFIRLSTNGAMPRSDELAEQNFVPPMWSAPAPQERLLRNPFVSGGYVKEFTDVHESSDTQRLLHRKDSFDSEKYGVASENFATGMEPSNAPQSGRQPSSSYGSPPAHRPSAPRIQSPVSTGQSPVGVRYQSQARQIPNSLPSRQPEAVITYPQKTSTSWQNYPPAGDPRFEYNPIESLSNSLGIHTASRVPPPPASYQQSSTRSKSPYQLAAARHPVSGNGWQPRQINGHASTSSFSQDMGPPRAGRLITPESTRSSTTPPGLSSTGPYTSPSPPGFLHSISNQKPPQARGSPSYARYGQSSTQTPQQQHSHSTLRDTFSWTNTGMSGAVSSVNISLQSTCIQAPRPMAPPSAAAAVLQFMSPIDLMRSTPSDDLRGKKRAFDDVPEPGPSRPRKRNHPWPSLDSIYSVMIKSDDPGIHQITFSSDGERFAVTCNDKTIRIWNMVHKVETACLPQSAPVLAVEWMIDDVGVVCLGQDGLINKWTRNNQNHWQLAKLFDAGKEDSVCFAYQGDRIAVAFPRIGVKVWIWIKGTWQPQRSILRQNVTCIKFVEDGEALIGGTSDGVLWYCQVPNGTLRAYAFLKSKVLHLDVNSSGSHALVSQSGGRAHLVGIQQMDHKGKVEQVYATNEESAIDGGQQVANAVFANAYRSVLFGMADGNLLMWDKVKGEIVCGYDHDGDHPQAIATFDKGPTVHMVTGTRRGLLSWWRPPAAD